MRRVIVILLGSLVLIAGLITPVAATATPIDERRVRTDIPLTDTLLVIEAEIGCGDFDVRVEDISGKVTYVFITEDRHGNILERIIYHTVTEYTNLTSGASFTRRFDSVGNITIRPDGTVKVIARNDTLIWGLEPSAIGLADGLWLIDKGRLILEYDAEGEVAGAELQEGETIDVCALLR